MDSLIRVGTYFASVILSLKIAEFIFPWELSVLQMILASYLPFRILDHILLRIFFGGRASGEVT